MSKTSRLLEELLGLGLSFEEKESLLAELDSEILRIKNDLTEGLKAQRTPKEKVKMENIRFSGIILLSIIATCSFFILIGIFTPIINYAQISIIVISIIVLILASAFFVSIIYYRRYTTRLKSFLIRRYNKNIPEINNN